MISESTRQKMREARLKNPTKYWKGKSTNPGLEAMLRWKEDNPPIKYWLGKKRPEIKKWLIPLPAGIYKHTQEAKDKISVSHKGSKHYRWNPDREAVKKNLRNDGEYLQWVLRVKKRDKGQCKIKNKGCSGYLIVHHILSWSQYPELRYEINNGITLCQAHHPRKRAEEVRLAPIFQDIVSTIAN